MRKRIHWLKKVRVRQDWSKENLYNLSRLQRVSTVGTYFQQKWAAKSATRAYHGEQIREKQWQRMFSRRLPAVQEMNPGYLARFDGSEKAAGRGGGRDDRKDLLPMSNDSLSRNKPPAATPYMQMVYHPMERRLDIAVFRSLFASSTRQARQFVVHGFVKVNGKKMIYPGYLLNPGDMFQVEPERVLWATGARKDQHRYGPKPPRIHPALRMSSEDDEELKPGRQPTAPATVKEEDAEEEIAADAADEPLEDDAEVEELSKASEAQDEVKPALKTLMRSIKHILEDSKSVPGKRKIEFRALHKEVKRSLSSGGTTIDEVGRLEEQLAAIRAKLPEEKAARQREIQAAAQEAADTATAADAQLQAALAKVEENPVDPTKPYLTPWRPRDYMSPFAFIPPYLEVNQRICSAVYLRHPVARPGAGEVPTPFNLATGQLAFNWYLRRR